MSDMTKRKRELDSFPLFPADAAKMKEKGGAEVGKREGRIYLFTAGQIGYW